MDESNTARRDLTPEQQAELVKFIQGVKNGEITIFSGELLVELTDQDLEAYWREAYSK